MPCGQDSPSFRPCRDLLLQAFYCQTHSRLLLIDLVVLLFLKRFAL